jgi:hypothetical protein
MFKIPVAKLFYVIICSFLVKSGLAQPLVINERNWGIGAETGFLSLYDDFNLFANPGDLPNGLNFGIHGTYYWKQENKRVTRLGVGIRYEYMYAYRVSVPSLHTVSESYSVNNQDALGLQLYVSRLLPFSPSSAFYGLLGARANVTLIGRLTGKYRYYGPVLSTTNVYNQDADPNRIPLNAGLYTGVGMNITDQLCAEIQFNVCFSPVRFYRLSLGTLVALHFSIGKPDTTEKKIFTRG